MPGIAGIIRRQPCVAAYQDLRLMTDAMRHETYYVCNQYVDPSMGIFLGWASHPNSLGAYMPLVSDDKRIVLIIVGEHFSPHGKSLRRDGTDLRERSDQELLQLYAEGEDRFLDSLNGWFSGVAIDLRLHRLTLFNDRYGMSRVYFHEGEDEFIFSSEAKSLLRVRPTLRSVDPEALAQFLRFNCVMGNKTLFKRVSLLPAGSAWDFDNSSFPRKKRYFEFTDWERQPKLRPEEFHQKFEETVSRVFPAYMEGPSEVAFSLTAGLDTRTILAAGREQERPFPCYTFGGPWGDTFDIRTARTLSEICRLPHEVVRINEEFFRDFPSYARKSVYISDGTHDAFGAHDLYFNQIVRNIAPIRLTGKFGSEVVRTRRLIHPGDFKRALVQPELDRLLDAVPSFESVSREAHPISRVVSEEIPWYEFGRVAVEQSQIILRTPYMDNDIVKLMYQAPPWLRASRDPQGRYVSQRSQALGHVPTNMGGVRYGSPLISKGAYLFLRVFFKAEYIYLFAAPHWMTWVDRKLEKLQPERILAGRQKFEYYRIWAKTHFADFIQDTLLSPGAFCATFFNRASLTSAVRGHLAGTHNYMSEINKALTLELMHSTLLNQ